VQLSSVPLQQLLNIREQVEAEVQQLTQSSITLQKVAGEYATSGRAVEELSQQKEGQPMLVPLTQSVYVAGELADTDRILLDIGTGYFAQKSLDGGVDYCKRKVNFIAESLNELAKARASKAEMLMAVERTIAQKQNASAGQPAK